MSNHKNLVFFNKEGDYLNAIYNDTNERFEADILMHENSVDTYKTYGIYTMEKIPTFEFESPGNLLIEKFQLFNEYGFHFYGSATQSHPILSIEPVNNDSTFYSKWIYGINFETLFPIGTQISFMNSFLEFTDPKRTYTVIQNKKNAVMIISEIDNASFEINYFTEYKKTTNYYTTFDKNPVYRLYVRGVNAVGIYNYIDSTYQNNISSWSEPNFYDMISVGRKINVTNTSLNDGTYTIVDDNLVDLISYEYYVTSLPADKDLTIEYKSKADMPRVYDGKITITADSKVYFQGTVPDILRPGKEFRISGSTLNQNALRVASIPNYEGALNAFFIATASQYYYKGELYECIKAYDHSPIDEITPFDREYWVSSTYLPVEQSTQLESIPSAQLYITSDKMRFVQAYTQSSAVTLASAAENFREDMKFLNVDLYYKNGILKADLIYSGQYAEVDFYSGTDMIGKTLRTNERIMEVKEVLKPELNYDINENFKYNLVFTDIDEYGIKVVINKEVYEEEAALIYTGASLDMERTIDRTLRNWLERNYLSLHLLGINTELEYIGSVSSPFLNSIIVKSEYPNVPIVINEVLVGSTAKFHIEHSRVLFGASQSIGATLNVKINGKDYKKDTIWATHSATASYKNPDVPATLEAWVDEHGPSLLEKGLMVSNINNLLKFDLTRTDIDHTYTIETGLLQTPGANEYRITDKIKGHFGSLITSNSMTLPVSASMSFLEKGFATGMVVGINNSLYPLENREYNITNLDALSMNLSYLGPIWGSTYSLCNSSAYVTIAFNSGFGQTACVPTPVIGVGSPFELDAFENLAFTKFRTTTAYATEAISLMSVPGSSNMVDIIYLQIAENIYILADNLIVMDAIKYEYLSYVELTGNTNSIKLVYNGYNNYLYCLSQSKVWVVDPLINLVMTSITLSHTAKDIAINPNNGDVYISYDNSPTISVYDWTSQLVKTITTPEAGDTKTGKMAWNAYEEDIYVTTDGNQVLRINGSNRTIQTSYTITGLSTDKIFYEPAREGVYVWSNNDGLWKIDNGITTSIPGVTNSVFMDALYNNLTGEINISDNQSFKSLELDNNTLTFDVNFGDYGYIALNQHDGMLYMTSQVSNSVLTINTGNGWVVNNEPALGLCTKIIYNPIRKSVWTIQPGKRSVFEVTPDVDTAIIPTTQDSIKIDESKYGTLSDEYVKRESIWLKAREYFRKPRENFEGETQVSYYWEWFDDQTPEFFLYDISGEQLPTGTSYSYIGPKPLPEAALISNPNKDLTKIASPEFQQTIFDRVYQKLDYINSDTDITSEPEAIQTFIGFKSFDEGTSASKLYMYKREPIEFSITAAESNTNTISLTTLLDSNKRRIGQLKLDTNSTEYFTGRGLKPGQYISLKITDNTNKTNQYTSYNSGRAFKIKEVYSRTIILEFFQQLDFIVSENTKVSNYPTTGTDTYLKLTIKVLDKEIAMFNVYGETEDEDIRFRVNLSNIGKNIGANEIFIFKDYDIQEGGIDYRFLNTKRKEMLMMKNDIFMYIGSYKSIINAINFFGYNDLKLNEYYKNTIPTSKDLGKLFKVEIPDIFDNSTPGWNDKDFLKHTFPNDNYTSTNLFNLTFDITDKDGNNVLGYTLDEIIIKLQGLKFWLSRNVVPMTHKILDITGSTYFRAPKQITHKMHDMKMFKIRENMTPITFKLNEAYLLPVNSGSTVYNCVLDFYTLIKGAGEDPDPNMIGNAPIPMNGVELILPDYFDVRIRTYKTYKEWAPFITYGKGERIMYYNTLYESTINSNKVNNPRKYESVEDWILGIKYEVTNVVKYKRRVYTFSGLGGNDYDIPPLLDQGDNGNWLDITEWVEIDYTPVQTISEYRRIKHPPIGATASGKMPPNPIPPFNFTVDSNLDPFIVIEVTSDNGRGGVYRDKKAYEIRGIKDLSEKITPIEKLGPFEPISLLK